MTPLFLFAPEIWLGVIALILLGLTLKNQVSSGVLYAFMLASTALLTGLCLFAIQASGTLFSGSYRVDLISQVFKTMVAASLFFTVLFSRRALSMPEKRRIETYFFLCSGALGMMMITSAADLLTLYVALELSAYSLYLLSSLRNDSRNAEAGVKYLVFGAATSGFFLWGASLLSGIAGGTSFAVIAHSPAAATLEPVFLLGALLVVFSFLFKLSAFPAHFWAPDVYESASTPIVNFIATASKATAVAILIRFFMLIGLPTLLVPSLALFAFVSMTLGNSVALVQTDVKRLLAYSSIAQAGYILVGLMAGSVEGYSSAIFYALAYVLMNTGVFLAVVKVAEASGQDNPGLKDFDGLAERSPFLALILLLSLLSLAGIPPLAGFTGKWILFSAAMDKGHWFLVLWGVLNSVVSLFYYLTIVKHAYLEKPKDTRPIVLPLEAKLVGLFLFAALLLLGIFPNAFISLAQHAILQAVSF